MNYKDLKNTAEARNIMIKDLAAELGMTPNGFKVSIENQTFPIGKVSDLCASLGITIADFFSCTSESRPAEYQSVVSEPVDYTTPSQRRTESTDGIFGLIRHITWLEAEIDRLRAYNKELTKNNTK